jgi:hypothetical protein
MTKENELENDLNKLEINSDRGLELLISHGRKPLQETIRIFCIEIKFLKYKLSFDIKKITQGEEPC